MVGNKREKEKGKKRGRGRLQSRQALEGAIHSLPCQKTLHKNGKLSSLLQKPQPARVHILYITSAVVSLANACGRQCQLIQPIS